MAISQENIIIEWLSNSDQLRADLKANRKEVERLQSQARSAGKSIEDALKTSIVKKYQRLVGTLNSELANAEGITDGLREGLEDALSTVPPERYVDTLVDINNTLDEAIQKSGEFGGESESVFSRVRRSVATFAGNARSSIGNAISSVGTFLSGSLNVVSRITSSILSTIGRITGAVLALGLADLIAGWSTFSQQVQTTVDKFPLLRAGADVLNRQFRVLGELFGRTIAPVFSRFINFLSEGLANTNLGGIQRAFTALVTLIRNISSSIIELFGAGGVADKGFDAFVNGFTSAIAIANGIWQGFLDFLKTIEPFFQDVAATIVDVFSLLNRAVGNVSLAEALKGVSLGLRENASEARKEIEGVVNAFRRGRDEILAIPPSDVKWSDITPTPTDEEVKAFEDALKRQREALLEWLQTLEGINQEFPIGGAENILNRVQDVNERFRDLIAEARRLGEQGILNDAQVKTSINRLIELRDRALKPLRDEFNEFVDLPDLTPESQLELDLKDPKEVIESLGRAFESQRGRIKFTELEEFQRLLNLFQLLQVSLNTLNNVARGFFSSLREQVSFQIGQLDRLVQAQENRVDRAAQLAEEGNTAILEAERARLQQSLQAREQAQRREQRLAQAQIAVAQAVAIAQGIAAILQAALTTTPIGAIAQAIALAGTIAGFIITLKNSFGNIQAFREGEPFVTGPGSSRSDSVPSWLSRGERVVDARSNQKIGGAALSNEKLVDYVQVGRSVMSGESVPAVFNKDTNFVASMLGLSIVAHQKKLDSVIDEISGLRNDMQKLSVYFNVTDKGIEAAVERSASRRQRRKKIIR